MKIALSAELRTDLGKGASRRLRHAEKMPAILYGAGQDPVSLVFEQKDIRAYIEDEHFYTSILDLNINGKSEQVVVRDIQHHPYKIDPMHIDFQRVDEKHTLHMHVPLHFIGEEKSPGVKAGGQVSRLEVEVEVECLPKNIPEFIEVDVSGMETGDIIHLTDLKLPANVEILALKQGEDHDTAVVSIHAPKGGADAEEEAAEGGEEAGE